jgi:hypothetical protein
VVGANIKDFVSRPRDTITEDRVATELRAEDPDKAFAFIWGLLDRDSIVALILARRVLRKRHYFEQILRQGLTAADASAVRFWIECCLPRLGADKVFSILSAVIEENGEVARRVLYWSRVLLLKERPSLRQKLDKLGAGRPNGHVSSK